MKQTPAHENHNPDLLKFIPNSCSKLIEIGCSSGALAKAYKEKKPTAHYVGVEIDSDYAEMAQRYCDESLSMNIENATDAFFKKYSDRDCWIFGDTLEHLVDPWKTLANIRKVLPGNGCVVVCIPNVQHWSLQVKLCIGDFRYEEDGLLDKTHLRWFTRQTMIELFNQSGFEIDAAIPRIFNEPNRDLFLPLIERLASRSGVDSKIAVQDALPLQYVMRAIIKN